MSEDERLEWLRKQIGDPEKVRSMVERAEFLDALHAATGDPKRLEALIGSLGTPEEIALYRQMLADEAARNVFRRRLFGGIADIGRRSREIALTATALAGAFYIVQALWNWLGTSP
jgi:hypothetical protein